MNGDNAFSTSADRFALRLAINRVCSLGALGIGAGSLIGYAIHDPAILTWTNHGIAIALPTALGLTLLGLANIILPVRL